MKVFLSIIASCVAMGFTAFFIIMPVVRFIRNDRGWRRMEEDRKAKRRPFYGDMEEELEKEKYGIED